MLVLIANVILIKARYLAKKFGLAGKDEFEMAEIEM